MFADFSLSEDDFLSVDWETFIREIQDKTCDQYSRVFLSEANKIDEDGHQKTRQALLFLHGVTSLLLRVQDENHPLQPMFSWSNGSRSAIVEDFSDDQIELLFTWLPSIQDAELAARVGDLIWTRKRRGHYRAAELAIEAYLTSGESLLDSADPYHGVERITRAVQIAASLGRGTDWLQTVLSKVETIIEKKSPSFSHEVAHFMRLLLLYRAGDPNKYASIAENLAVYHQDRGAWHYARVYWELKANWHRLAGDSDRENEALEKAAHSYVEEAESAVRNGRGYGVAAHHLQSAIFALRKIPGTEEKRTVIHRKLLEYQQNSTTEFGSMRSGEVDLTNFVEHLCEHLQGRSVFDAIIALALFSPPPDKSSVEKYVDEMMRNSPFSALIVTNMLDDRGRIVGQRPSLMFEDSEEEKNRAKTAEMYRWVQYEQEAIGLIVDAGRNCLLLEHNPSINDLIALVINNPVVSPGHEIIIAKGLLEGFRGDYLTALHILVPQIESSLRFVLNQAGEITTSLNEEGIQEEFDLNRLLDFEKLTQILDEDIVFNLKSTLVGRFGFNLRNRLAHGLLEYGHFHSHMAAFVWWLILHFFARVFTAMTQENNDQEETNETEDS